MKCPESFSTIIAAKTSAGCVRLQAGVALLAIALWAAAGIASADTVTQPDAVVYVALEDYAAFSPNDAYYAARCSDSKTRIFSSSGALLHALSGEYGGPKGFLGSGSTLWTQNDDVDPQMNYLWNAATGTLLQTITANIEEFSADGSQYYTKQWISTSTWECAVYDTATGSLVRSLVNHGSFSPNWNYTVKDGATVELYSTANDQLIASWPKPEYPHCVFSPDSSMILTDLDGSTLELRSTQSGTQLRTIAGNDSAFSPDSTLLAVTVSGQGVQMWSTSTGQLVRTLGTTSGSPSSGYSGVSFSADGTRIVTNYNQGFASETRIFTVSTGALEGTLPEFASGGLSPNLSMYLASDSDNYSVEDLRLHTRATGQQVLYLGPQERGDLYWAIGDGVYGIDSFGFSPDGSRVRDMVLVADSSTGGIVGNLSVEYDNYSYISNSWAVSGNGAYAIMGEGSLFVCDVSALKSGTASGISVLRELSMDLPYNEELQSVALSYDGARAMIGILGETDDGDGNSYTSGPPYGTAYLFDTATGSMLFQMTGHSDGVCAVAVSKDNKRALTGSKDKTAKLWNAETGQEVRTFSGHTNYVTSVAFSPDGSYVLTGSADNTARLWNTETGALVRVLIGHSGTVYKAVFSSDGGYVLTGSADGTMKLWSTETGAVVRLFDSDAMDWYTEDDNMVDDVMAVAFSPAGDRVAGCGPFGITIWDITDLSGASAEGELAGEGEATVEGEGGSSAEGESPVEGEGESAAEGEPTVEGEGESATEGEGEGEGEPSANGNEGEDASGTGGGEGEGESGNETKPFKALGCGASDSSGNGMASDGAWIMAVLLTLAGLRRSGLEGLGGRRAQS